MPSWFGYYQLLTVHGVILGLVLTTFFILGFMLAAQSKTAGKYNNGERKWAWIGFWMMTIGVAIITIFILLLLFSIPVGFHHQLTEPGIDSFWKYIQVVLTFLVVIPSLMTAFSLFATFEARGSRIRW